MRSRRGHRHLSQAARSARPTRLVGHRQKTTASSSSAKRIRKRRYAARATNPSTPPWASTPSAPRRCSGHWRWRGAVRPPSDPAVALDQDSRLRLHGIATIFPKASRWNTTGCWWIHASRPGRTPTTGATWAPSPNTSRPTWTWCQSRRDSTFTAGVAVLHLSSIIRPGQVDPPGPHRSARQRPVWRGFVLSATWSAATSWYRPTYSSTNAAWRKSSSSTTAAYNAAACGARSSTRASSGQYGDRLRREGRPRRGIFVDPESGIRVVRKFYDSPATGHMEAGESGSPRSRLILGILLLQTERNYTGRDE